MTQREELFEGRYGSGAFSRLIEMLEQPCVTFAAIAKQFDVSRERVRQWHLEFRPDAPRGHERQRLCVAQRSKRELLRQPLFREFCRRARTHFEPRDLTLIRARDGFRRTAVRLNTHLIAIRLARTIVDGSGRPRYFLNACSTPVDFVYYQLGEESFIFLPRQLLPPSGALYNTGGRSRYEPFRDTFGAAFLESVDRVRRRRASNSDARPPAPGELAEVGEMGEVE